MASISFTYIFKIIYIYIYIITKYMVLIIFT